MTRNARFLRRLWALGLLTALGSSSAYGVGVSVGADATVSLGSGSLDLGCADLSSSGAFNIDSGAVGAARHVLIAVGGLLNGGVGSISMSGNWTNSGGFSAGSGSVSIVDGCATSESAFLGDTGFNDLSITSGSGRQLTFQAGSTQTVTGSVTMTGAAGNLLKTRSSTPGTPAFIDVSGASPQDLGYLDIQDSHATGLESVPPPNSVDNGGTEGWFGRTQAIPTLSGGAMALLALLLAFAVRRKHGTTALAG